MILVSFSSRTTSTPSSSLSCSCSDDCAAASALPVLGASKCFFRSATPPSPRRPSLWRNSCSWVGIVGFTQNQYGVHVDCKSRFKISTLFCFALSSTASHNTARRVTTTRKRRREEQQQRSYAKQRNEHTKLSVQRRCSNVDASLQRKPLCVGRQNFARRHSSHRQRDPNYG